MTDVYSEQLNMMAVALFHCWFQLLCVLVVTLQTVRRHQSVHDIMLMQNY